MDCIAVGDQQQHQYDDDNRVLCTPSALMQAAITQPEVFPHQYMNENSERSIIHPLPAMLRQPLSESPNRLQFNTKNTANDHEDAQHTNSMYSTFNNEVITTSCHPSRFGTKQFATNTLHCNRNISNSSNQRTQSFNCDYNRQQNCMTQAATIFESCSVNELLDWKNTPRKNQGNSSSTCRSKKSFKRKRGSQVINISTWDFPPGTKNKHKLVGASIRRGINPRITEEYQDIPTLKSVRARRAIFNVVKQTKFNKGSKKLIHPTVTDAEFDKRFLKYELSPSGEKKMEILVRSFSMSSLPSKNRSQAKEAWENDHIAIIQNEPSRSTTSSRIGPRYQARIPSKLTGDAFGNADDRSIHGYDQLWDPKLAEEAEKIRGENISGFLEGNHELCTQESLFTILHNNDYCVDMARLDLDRVRKHNKEPLSSKLNKNEERRFEALIRDCQKDFATISEKLNRKRSDCLIHYYRWKASSRSYQGMKTAWKDSYCSVCQDGGDLIICDGCNSNFHMECVNPPLTAVPEGNWFCHSCQYRKLKVMPSLLEREKKTTNNIPIAKAAGEKRDRKEDPSVWDKSNDSFPVKLYRMVQLATLECPLVCSWSQDGRSFVIHSKSDTLSSILQRHFNHSRWLSFSRQLNNYGFTLVVDKRKESEKVYRYFHPKFHRDINDPNTLAKLLPYLPGERKRERNFVSKYLN